MKNLKISPLSKRDLEQAYKLFEIGVADAFQKEGISELKESIENEIIYKRNLLDDYISLKDGAHYFLIAKLDCDVVGIIAYGSIGQEIKECTLNELDDIVELGSLYVLPQYQDQGIGRALIKAMMNVLNEREFTKFCLDCGYKTTQKKWLKKFGTPYKIVKDFWGVGSDHYIWLCSVSDFLD